MKVIINISKVNTGGNGWQSLFCNLNADYLNIRLG